MKREEMIEQLVSASVQALLADPHHTAMRRLLEQGCNGLRGLSDAALRREMQLHGLLDFDEPDPGDVDFEDDADEDDDDTHELRLRACEMATL